MSKPKKRSPEKRWKARALVAEAELDRRNRVDANVLVIFYGWRSGLDSIQALETALEQWAKTAGGRP